MNRIVVAVLLLALLGVPVVAGCGDSQPQAPPQAPSTATAPAPDQEERTAERPPNPGLAAPDPVDDTVEVVKKHEVLLGPDGGVVVRRPGGVVVKKKLPRPERIRRLIKCLESKDTETVRGAANALRRLDAEVAVPALIRHLQSHEDDLVRLEAARALRRMCSADVVPSLIQSLGDKNCLVRLVAWDALDSVARVLRETPGEGDWNKEYGKGRGRFLEAPQEDIQRRLRAWWGDNEAAYRQKLASQDKYAGLR